MAYISCESCTNFAIIAAGTRQLHHGIPTCQPIREYKYNAPLSQDVLNVEHSVLQGMRESNIHLIDA